MIKYQSTVVHLDELVIFSKTVNQQVKLVRQAHTLLEDTKATVKLKKSFYFSSRLSILASRSQVGYLKVQKLLPKQPSNWTISQIRLNYVRFTVSVMGSAECFLILALPRPFLTAVEEWTITEVPCTSRRRKASGWNSKGLLRHPPILALPRAPGNYTVDTNMCNKLLGFMLLQKQPNVSTK